MSSLPMYVSEDKSHHCLEHNNMTNKVNPSPSKPGGAAQKKPFSMNLPPLARQPFLQPKPLWDKPAVKRSSAKAGSRGQG
jgi:hypothetical protein